MYSRGLGVAAVLGLVFGLVGCGDDDSPPYTAVDAGGAEAGPASDTSDTTDADTTAADTSDTTDADTTDADTTDADTTDADTSDTTDADTTDADTSDTTDADTTAADTSDTTDVDTTAADTSDTTDADAGPSTFEDAATTPALDAGPMPSPDSGITDASVMEDGSLNEPVTDADTVAADAFAPDAALLDAAAMVSCAQETLVEDGSSWLIPNQNTFARLEVCSALSATDAVSSLRNALTNAGLGVPVDLDHQAAAQSVELDLGASHLFVFGNPALGTPIMQESPLAGLDLPLKMLVFEDNDGNVRVTYDGPDALRHRFALTSVDTQLEQAANALANFAGVAAGATVQVTQGAATAVGHQDGIVTVSSYQDGPNTLAALTTAIGDNPNIEVLTQVDHQAAAGSLSLSLGFSTLVIFGSPAVGTPLMQTEPSVGLDLPLKMLVAQVGPSVVLAYSSPTFTATRHGGLPEHEARLTNMANVLESLAQTAAGTPP